MPSGLDSGVRYVLPMFVFLSMMAATGLVTLWTRRHQRIAFRMAAAVLFGWLIISSARSHPDYLAYFNELGGSDPSHLIVVGDLDWGQDLTRLSTYLREHSVDHINIAYDGFYDPDSLGLPQTQKMKCGEKPSGWTAVELRRARLYSECYPWIDQKHFITTVGKTMSIYDMP
jgi:hypothetical protein